MSPMLYYEKERGQEEEEEVGNEIRVSKFCLIHEVLELFSLGE